MRRNRDGKIHSRGAKPRVSVLKIHYESRKAHPQSTTSGKISPRMGNKFITSGEATSGELLPMSGDILPRVVELGMCLE